MSLNFDYPDRRGVVYHLTDEQRKQIEEAQERMRQEFEAHWGGPEQDQLISFSIRSVGVGKKPRNKLLPPFNPETHQSPESLLKYSRHKFLFGRYVNQDSFIIHARQCGKQAMRASYLDAMYHHLGIDLASGRDQTVKLQLAGRFGKHS